MDFVRHCRVKHADRMSLSKHDPADTGNVKNKESAVRLLERGIERLSAEQDRLFAQNKWAVLIILQAMDAAGKDSTVKHVMSGVNPQGCSVTSFKAPTAEELDHDYLWRSAKALPERGNIGIHNRSHYEEVIVTRVHPEILIRQRLPHPAGSPKFWRQRFREINRFERHLVDNGTIVLKFFLNVSKDEQKRRFLERMEEPEKFWKFQPGDVREREHWDEYMDAYQEVFRHTSTQWAPWYIVPADHKWFTRLAVAEIIVSTLADLKLKYPSVPDHERTEWRQLRKQLENE
jgi:PPK2 family polyphosphate:nucleotide phosphotransferase